MRFRQEAIKAGIKYLGGVQEGEFTTAAGDRATRKVELDILKKQTRASLFIRQLVISELITMVEPFEPDVILSIPTGADHLANGLSKRLYVPAAYLNWVDKTPANKRLETRTTHDAELIAQAGRIALIDDVFSTGSSLSAVYGMEAMEDKTVSAFVVWDRSDGSRLNQLPFMLEAAVSEYIPLQAD